MQHGIGQGFSALAWIIAKVRAPLRALLHLKGCNPLPTNLGANLLCFAFNRIEINVEWRGVSNGFRDAVQKLDPVGVWRVGGVHCRQLCFAFCDDCGAHVGVYMRYNTGKAGHKFSTIGIG